MNAALRFLVLCLPVQASHCPAGYFSSPAGASWGHHCYGFPHDYVATHRECERSCELIGASLACVHSAEENAWLTRALRDDMKVPAGYEVWLGQYVQKVEGKRTTVSCSAQAVRWGHMAGLRVNPKDGREFAKCFAVHPHHGSWEMADCLSGTDERNGFLKLCVCEKSGDASPELSSSDRDEYNRIVYEYEEKTMCAAARSTALFHTPTHTPARKYEHARCSISEQCG